jgi:hypothetical protein
MKPDLTALLRAANPVPPARIGRLRAELQAAGGAARVTTSREVRDLPRPPRRYRSLKLAVALVVLAGVTFLVGPAIGIPLPALRFFSAHPAPAPVVKDFASLGTGAPPGMDPGVLAGQTRRVTTVHARDGAHTLWVAPTEQGGLCLEWTDESGGCDKLGTVPLSVTWSSGSFAMPRGRGVTRPASGAVTRVVGFVHREYAETVEIRFADGEIARPAIVWVSPPIDAGFFFYDVPEVHQHAGHEIASVSALNGEGEVVTQEGLARDLRFADGIPADADVPRREVAAKLETRHGEAVVWKAPTRYDGRCWWLEFEGQRAPVGPCLPHRYPVQGVAIQLLGTRDTVLLVGLASVPSFELTYADGARIEIPVRNGAVLFEIPPSHLVAGHEPSQLRVNGRTGAPPFDLRGMAISRLGRE